jgi:hypothetical protein
MIDDTYVISDIITKGYTVTKNAKLIKKYKKEFPNYHVHKHMGTFFFMDLDRVTSIEPFRYADGSAETEYFRLIFKSFNGGLGYQVTKIITLKTFEEIKELLIKRKRYDILLNLTI